MCTGIRFTDASGNMFFGRNLDWSFSYGEEVLVTPRNYPMRYAFLNGGAPTTGYAVIGMGITEGGVPLYFDCANEHGLAVGGLNFPGYAQYENDAVAGKTNLAAYEFPLWVARTFESVDDVEAVLHGVAIVGKPVNDRYPVSMLHWMIADAKRSIVVEYMADGIHVYDDDVDILANQPTFAWHRENLRNYISVTNDFPAPVSWGSAELTPYGAGSGMRGLPGDVYSPSRFVRAAYINAHYPVQNTEVGNVSRLFHTLAGVAMVDGCARMGDGRFEKTLYTGGFYAANNTYYYSTYDDPAIRAFALADNDLDGDAVEKAVPRA